MPFFCTKVNIFCFPCFFFDFKKQRIDVDNCIYFYYSVDNLTNRIIFSRVSPLMQHNARDKSTSGPPVEGLYDNERNCVEDFYTSSNRNTMTPLRSMVS